MKKAALSFAISYDREIDGRWIAEIPQVPGALSYGFTKEEAGERAARIARRSHGLAGC